MENASKALLIAGAILLCILIIAIGMFIYNSAQSTITDSINTLSTQEVEAFNNQFLSYEGVQKGTNIKNLMGKLIANANTYVDEPAKIPWIILNYSKSEDAIGGRVLVPGETQAYIDICARVNKIIKTNKEYYVFFTNQKNGLIDIIYIHYDKNFNLNGIESPHREDFM